MTNVVQLPCREHFEPSDYYIYRRDKLLIEQGLISAPTPPPRPAPPRGASVEQIPCPAEYGRSA